MAAHHHALVTNELMTCAMMLLSSFDMPPERDTYATDPGRWRLHLQQVARYLGDAIGRVHPWHAA